MSNPGSGKYPHIDGDRALDGKLDALRARLAELGSVAVAFSGGVDSSLLLAVAHEVLGDRAVALTAASPSFPERELAAARAFCEERGIEQVVFDSDELEIEGFDRNPPNRCYLCKHELFSKVAELAAKRGLAFVAEGSNLDDMGDYRPGMQAVAELGICSPLRDADMTKADIRAISEGLGLPTWDKPSFACLASRFVYGEHITREKLARIDAAEQLLIDLGFTQTRVRVHGDMARIEVPPADIARLASDDVRPNVAQGLGGLGFTYVSLDLTGYRTGSMNEALTKG